MVLSPKKLSQAFPLAGFSDQRKTWDFDMVLAPVALGVIAFTSAGITAGSYAAAMISSTAIANGGGVAAGGLVAGLQSSGSEALSQGQPQQETELPLICQTLQGKDISISSSDTRDPAWVVSRAMRPQGHGVHSKQQLCIIQHDKTLRQ